MTRNIAGKMNITVGKSILIGAFIAFSSAAAWRLRRLCVGRTLQDVPAGFRRDGEVGPDEAEAAKHEREEEDSAGSRHRAAEDGAEGKAADGEPGLEGQERGRRERAPEPGREEPRADSFDGRLRVQL